MVRGELEFEKLLRIDGLFTGRLISKGDLIVGSMGKLVGDVNDMNCVLVDGTIVGDINVNFISLRANSSVHGNITCKSVSIDASAIIVGTLNVHPKAPQLVDSDGNIRVVVAPKVNVILSSLA